MTEDFKWDIDYIPWDKSWILRTSRPELNGHIRDVDVENVIESLKAIQRGEE